MGEEIKENILACVYCSNSGNFIHSSMRGVDECNDFGRMSINNGAFFTKSHIMEVHLHPADKDHMAVSPNNGAFLLNLTMPIVHFYVIICTVGHHQILSVFK